MRAEPAREGATVGSRAALAATKSGSLNAGQTCWESNVDVREAARRASRPYIECVRRGDSGDRVTVRDLLGERDQRAELTKDVREGLSKPLKELPPKYFYDARGSRLFERITALPEYYLTGAETRILQSSADAITGWLRARTLVEFGSGSSKKTHLLLDGMSAAGDLECYAPVDVSEEALHDAARRLVREYDDLEVVIVLADFDVPIDLSFADRPRLVAFLGSTIGNFTPSAGARFLESVARQLAPEDGFLIGFDLVKDTAVLEAAYNDAAGITAEFNLNLLRVLNRELGADFDLTAFRHRAFYDPERARIEMHLVSTRPQAVRFEGLGMTVEFQADETLRTELSHKYTRDSVASLLEIAGLQVARWETDPDELFALVVARAMNGGVASP